MHTVTAREFIAEGTATVLVEQYIPKRGVAATLLPDNGNTFTAKLSNAVCFLLGSAKSKQDHFILTATVASNMLATPGR